MCKLVHSEFGSTPRFSLVAFLGLRVLFPSPNPAHGSRAITSSSSCSSSNPKRSEVRRVPRRRARIPPSRRLRPPRRRLPDPPRQAAAHHRAPLRQAAEGRRRRRGCVGCGGRSGEGEEGVEEGQEEKGAL